MTRWAGKVPTHGMRSHPLHNHAAPPELVRSWEGVSINMAPRRGFFGALLMKRAGGVACHSSLLTSPQRPSVMAEGSPDSQVWGRFHGVPVNSSPDLQPLKAAATKASRPRPNQQRIARFMTGSIKDHVTLRNRHVPLAPLTEEIADAAVGVDFHDTDLADELVPTAYQHLATFEDSLV